MTITRRAYAALLVLAACFLPSRSLPAQTPPPPADIAEEIPGRLDSLLDAPGLRHATVGVLVRSLADGRVLYERNADLALMPASNQKLLTGAAALARLGPDFRFRTYLFRTGNLDKAGTLQGDLVLRGTGDPSLNSARLGEFVQAVRAAGIRRVAGRILGDETHFPGEHRLGAGWSWDNEPYAYQPQVSALNCDGNVVAVTVAPGPRPGAPATVTLQPRTAYVRVRNRVVTVAASRAPPEATVGVTFERVRARSEVRLDGTLPVGAKPITGVRTVEEPARYAATRLAELLRAAGVAVAEGAPALGATPPKAVSVAEIASEPLPVLLRHFLKVSDNLYGEVLMKTLGAEVAREGTWAAGAGVLRQFLASAGLDTEALAIRDGSGLSRLNAVTARNLVTLLTYLEREASPPVREAFLAALPVGGVDGTLRNRFRETPAAGNVRAKTGSLSGVSSLSGYVTTRAGEPLVFSILMNGLLRGATAARAAQDALVLTLLDAPCGASTQDGAARPAAEERVLRPLAPLRPDGKEDH